MTRFVIDAPTRIHLVLEPVKVHPTHQLVAPNGVRSQALTLPVDAVRRGYLAEREALVLEGRMTVVKMRLLGDRVSLRAAWRLPAGRAGGISSTRSTLPCPGCRSSRP